MALHIPLREPILSHLISFILSYLPATLYASSAHAYIAYRLRMEEQMMVYQFFRMNVPTNH